MAVSEKILEAVREVYPTFAVIARGDAVSLRGAFPLQVEGKTLTSYLISINFPQVDGEFVATDPITKEIGGRIPRNIDWHIYPKDGTCCFYPPEYFEINYLHTGTIGLLDYIDKHVRSFFISQYVFEQTAEWPFKAYSHGSKGILEYYEEITGIQGVQQIRRILQLIAQGGHINGGAQCFCGNPRINMCPGHFALLMKLKIIIPAGTARKSNGKLNEISE